MKHDPTANHEWNLLPGKTKTLPLQANYPNELLEWNRQWAKNCVIELFWFPLWVLDGSIPASVWRSPNFFLISSTKNIIQNRKMWTRLTLSSSQWQDERHVLDKETIRRNLIAYDAAMNWNLIPIIFSFNCESTLWMMRRQLEEDLKRRQWKSLKIICLTVRAEPEKIPGNFAL